MADAFHRASLAVWKRLPPRLAGFLRTLLTTRWAVGAVAVLVDEAVTPPEVLLVQHSYRTKGAWGLPGGSLESGLRNRLEPSKEEAREESRDDIIESSLRREVVEELLPKQGFSALREGLGTAIIKPRSPEVTRIVLVPVSRLKEYDPYSSDARILFALLT